MPLNRDASWVIAIGFALLSLWLFVGLYRTRPRGYAEHTTTIPMEALRLPVNAVRDLIVTRLGYKPEVAPTLLTWEIVAHAGNDFIVVARTANTPGH